MFACEHLPKGAHPQERFFFFCERWQSFHSVLESTSQFISALPDSTLHMIPRGMLPFDLKKTSPSCLSSLDLEGLFRLAELPRLRRWISNWTSLFLGLCCKHHVPCGALSIHHPRLRSSSPPVDFYRHLLDFDSTLGFPGEGPVVRWILFLALAGVDFSHGMLPRNRHDEARAASRSLKPLQTGRPVQTGYQDKP